MKHWDVFLSYASEEKESVAIPLAEALHRQGVRVWLDQMQISLGDGIRRKVDEGLANSRFGVVILSDTFFAKYWTASELDALWELEAVLPVWHGLDIAGVRKYSPLLAGKSGVSTAEGLDHVAREVADRVFRLRDSVPTSPAFLRRELALLINASDTGAITRFVEKHPVVLSRAIGYSPSRYDTFRANVEAGPYSIDFIYSAAMTNSRYEGSVFFGPVDGLLFDDQGESASGIKDGLERLHAIRLWAANEREQRWKSKPADQQYAPPPSIDPYLEEATIVVGRRPQPGSPQLAALQKLNSGLSYPARTRLRTYDWLLDTAFEQLDDFLSSVQQQMLGPSSG